MRGKFCFLYLASLGVTFFFFSFYPSSFGRVDVGIDSGLTLDIFVCVSATTTIGFLLEIQSNLLDAGVPFVFFSFLF